MTTIIERVKAPTPNFFKKLRSIGLVLAGIGAVLITAPVSLPAVLVTAGGYMATAGSVISVISQLTNESDDAVGTSNEKASHGDSTQ